MTINKKQHFAMLNISVRYAHFDLDKLFSFILISQTTSTTDGIRTYWYNLYMKYRWGRENDLPQIIGLLNLVKGDQRNLIADQFLIASYNKKIVGCIRILEQQGMRQLISFGVLPEHRRKRIGSALMKKLLKVKSQRPIYLLCFKDLENFYNQLSISLA